MASRYIALATLALAGITSAAPIAEKRQTTCYSGVYMIVARGTDEAAGEGVASAVASLVAGQIADSGSVAVDYPASALDPIYPDSVTDGINDAISLIEDYVNACGDSSRIALIGFSQGGNVMTDALAGGVDKPTPIGAPYTDYITAVTVFGDPSFTAGQSFDVGTSTSDGIFAREEGGASLALLNTYADILQSYCNTGDIYCASGDDSSVHSQEVPDYESAAAAFIVSKNS